MRGRWVYELRRILWIFIFWVPCVCIMPHVVMNWFLKYLLTFLSRCLFQGFLLAIWKNHPHNHHHKGSFLPSLNLIGDRLCSFIICFKSFHCLELSRGFCLNLIISSIIFIYIIMFEIRALWQKMIMKMRKKEDIFEGVCLSQNTIDIWRVTWVKWGQTLMIKTNKESIVAKVLYFIFWEGFWWLDFNTNTIILWHHIPLINLNNDNEWKSTVFQQTIVKGIQKGSSWVFLHPSWKSTVSDQTNSLFRDCCLR